MKLGIIGYGRMGKWFAEKLRDRFKVGVFDVNPEKLRGVTSDVAYPTLEDLIVDSDMILVSTPLKVTPEVLGKIREIVLRRKMKNKVIFDIATLKREVTSVLQTFPETVKVCSVHPLFGPGAKGFSNSKVVVVPIDGREKDAEEVKSLFESLGAEVTVSDSKSHDEAISFTIALPYFIGVSLCYLISQANLDFLEKYAGTSFRYLLTYMKAIVEEKPEFILALLSDRFSRSASERFLRAAEEVLQAVEKNSELLKILERIWKSFLRNEDLETDYKEFYRKIR